MDDDPTTRRGVLATAGAVALAGCSGLAGSSSGDGGNRPLRERTVEEVSRTVTLQPDSFESVPLSFDQQTVLFFSVVADAAVDVLTFRERDFERYRENAADQLRYVDALSEESTAATSLGSAVSPGNPVVVVDNTTWAETQPDGEVRVQLDLEAFVKDGG